MRIKATIVAYASLVQYFENATIVAYAGLRVKLITCVMLVKQGRFLGESKTDHSPAALVKVCNHYLIS